MIVPIIPTMKRTCLASTIVAIETRERESEIDEEEEQV